MAVIPGTQNNDSLIGGGDPDTISGGGGDDSIHGGGGNDRIWGDAGNDTIHGDDGDDEIDGGIGRDSIFGGAGNDTLRGGGDASGDYLDGGDGDDVFYLDNGNDTIIGGAGNDTVHANNGDDLVDAGDGDDSILAGEGNDTVFGGAGNDTVIAGNGNDNVYGGSGNDVVEGGEGSDRLFGEDGNDTILGGNDADTIDGGAGNDRLYGDAGRDSLFGGDGNDLLNGGADADTLTGGMGFDTFVAGNGDLVTDFNAGAEGSIRDGDIYNNDLLDLSAYYNDSTLARYNAANPGRTFDTPLAWLRADQADGVLNESSISMTVQSNGAATDPGMFTYENTRVVCFAADAMIEAEDGAIAAGDLKVGDLVRTVDHGLQPIRWIGKRELSSAELEATPQIRPIRIAKGALGQEAPSADLVVSPQHRMLIRSEIAQRMFGANEILAAAKQLLQLDGVDVANDLKTVTYVHFMFDDHEIVIANGAASESMYAGAEALNSVGPQLRDEILTIFPELREGTVKDPARVLASGRMARRLVVRHKQNDRPLVN